MARPSPLGLGGLQAVRAGASGEAWLLVALKLAIGALVWASGFRAVSDDDFARVVLMQKWSLAPALDPTQSSWLPLPFWIGGGAMSLFGTSLWVARATALALSGLSAWLLYRAARLLVGRQGAFAGTFVALWLPWSAYLGVSTVPEMLTGALCVFALATAVGDASAAQRTAGGLALLCACLSRYEAWLVALCFVGLLVWRRFRGPRPARESNVALGVALVLAALGPALWLAHNAMAYGDALQFMRRVSAYRAALHGSEDSWHAALRYLLLLLRQEPELWLAAAVVGVWQWRRPQWLPSTLGAASGCALVLLLALSVAAARGGAATHHSGRALLVVWLLAAIYVGAMARRRLLGEGRVFAAALLAGALVLGVTVLRPWYGRFQDFASREGESAFGERSARTIARVAQDERPLVLLDTVDYGYFAIQAGSGHPGWWQVERTLDPRRVEPRSGFSSCAGLRASVERLGAADRFRFAATRKVALPAAGGVPVTRVGGWSLYALPSAIVCE